MRKPLGFKPLYDMILSCVVLAALAIGLLGNSSSLIAAAPLQSPEGITVEGELKQWHKVTLTLDGPEASEDGDPNPFTDYRLQVMFMNADSGLSYSVPGYFAADGDAANTSATSGNKWRAHLSPDHDGEWTYRVSFRKGPGVAIGDDPNAGDPVEPFDGMEGTLVIAKTDKSGRDFRGKGRLNYVGKHHLQFAGTGEFFLKAGADAPENFLAYDEFDGDFKTDGHKDKLVKNWQPHVQDWQNGDPTWQNGKGKGIIGAVNYLAGQGLNVFSFLTMNIEGDDRNVYPYTTYNERKRIDVSRMDQWEILFEHADKLGMYLHFKTQEAENVLLLDGGETGPQRKLYYRELIARFAHHLALNWNLGEEVGLGFEVSTKKKVDWANYFWNHDPYQHHLVIHNGNRHYDMLGNASPLTGFSLQTNKEDFRNVHNQTKDYIRRSVQAGKPWVVACDEPGDASHSLVPDDEDPTRDNARKNALWGNIMAGGAGVEWYFGYKHAHSDLTCQDYRVRQKMWQQSRIALDFFADNDIPFQDMSSADDLVGGGENYCLAQPGKMYLVFRKGGGKTTLDLSDAKGVFEIVWFNPRNGGDLQQGSTPGVEAGGHIVIGNPPADPGQDWLAVIRPGNANTKVDPNAAVDPKSIDDGASKSGEGIVLNAVKDFRFVVTGDFVQGYVDKNQNALAIDASKHRNKFAAAESTYQGKAGTFDMLLSTLTETDGESTYRLFVSGKKVGEFQNPTTARDYTLASRQWKDVKLKPGDTIRVEFNSASNGKIPEGDAFAFSRGRWRGISIGDFKLNGSRTGSSHSSGHASAKVEKSAKKKSNRKKQTPPKLPPFEYRYDQSMAKKVHRQTDGVVVVEAEDYDAVDRQFYRFWCLTNADQTPDVMPDRDPNHSEGASGGAYLELLPDTRVTHGDPLVTGLSFSNTPGQCSVLYYPVEIETPGRYYVWVRMCGSGSEDNGLHVGLDGQWPESGARLQFTGQKGKWQWDSRQRTQKKHVGELGKIWLDIPTAGRHTVMFSMREDGFEFDKFMLTQNQKPMESKTLEMGPANSPLAK